MRGDPFLINQEARHEVEDLVILNQCFITLKMVASHLALREVRSKTSSALQHLKREYHSLHVVP